MPVPIFTKVTAFFYLFLLKIFFAFFTSTCFIEYYYYFCKVVQLAIRIG